MTCCAGHALHGGAGLDLSRSGCTDIVLGREDGSLEVYDMDEGGGLQQVCVPRALRRSRHLCGTLPGTRGTLAWTSGSRT